jgi:hypothetical protein
MLAPRQGFRGVPITLSRFTRCGRGTVRGPTKGGPAANGKLQMPNPDGRWQREGRYLVAASSSDADLASTWEGGWVDSSLSAVLSGSVEEDSATDCDSN